MRESNGYTSSRVDLSSLAGEDLRFRFRIGTDAAKSDYGWLVKLVKKGSTTRVGVTLNYDASTRKVVLDPRRALNAGATYRTIVTTGVRDAAGNQLDQNPTLTGNQRKVWFFTVRP